MRADACRRAGCACPTSVKKLAIQHTLTKTVGIALSLLLLATSSSQATTNHLQYAPAPPDNPLKGFVAYPNPKSDFPHSLVWNYLPLRSIMTGLTNFDWGPLEAELDNAARQGRQFIPRFYLDFPGRPTGIPQFLIDAGLKVFTWTNFNNDPFQPGICNTPDYENPMLRAALINFIAALGARYDKDPRLAYVPMGLLGLWGEWHNSPRNDLFASKTVQNQVMDAYQAAFHYTRILARYPAGSSDPTYAENASRNLGYHDDSFAWATMHTGRPQDSWFFQTRLQNAGALDKWRGHPIGGEVRPEVWNCLWDNPTCAPAGQEFSRCATNLHVTWLANHGVFNRVLPQEQLERALAGARLLGYEFHIPWVAVDEAFGDAPLRVSWAVTNSGIAPFYYDWPLELGAVTTHNTLAASWPTNHKLLAIQPGATERVMEHKIANLNLPPGDYFLTLRVVHPLKNGKPLRFANATQDQHLPDWLTLCPLHVATRPKVGAEFHAPDQFRLTIHNDATGIWRLESSTDLFTWNTISTNVPPAIILHISEAKRFFRLVRHG